MTGKAKTDKDKDDGNKPYTIDNAGRDLRLLAKSSNELTKTVNILTTNSKAMLKRLEAVEAIAGAESDEDFTPADKQKSLSILARQVFSPDDIDIIKSGMTEIPNRMVMPIVIERTMNEYIKILTTNPSSDVLLSDIFMKHYAIVMRALRRQLIQEAMGFSQIEMEKAVDEEERKIALEE